MVALLAVAALVAVLVAGTLLNRTPPPYGPATNGRIAYIGEGRSLVTGDLSTGTSKVLLEDQTGIQSPLHSQDGRRIAFVRTSTSNAGLIDLMVVGSDGSNLVQLSARPFTEPSYVGWSGRGDRILVVDASGQMLLFDTTRKGDAFDLSDQLGLGRVNVGPGYNFASTAAFRPPTGDEILFVTEKDKETLQVVRPDGTGLRTLIEPQSSPVAYSRLGAAEWSPDGTRIVVMLEFPGQPDRWHIHVLNADGTGLRPLHESLSDRLANQNSPLWSPDGTRIAFQYWTSHATDDGQDFHPIGVVDLATGEIHDVGPLLVNGAAWRWAPDGQSILEVPGDGAGEVLIVDATTGLVTKAPWTAGDPGSWQRVAE